jgi:hypothetical protein
MPGYPYITYCEFAQEFLELGSWCVEYCANEILGRDIRQADETENRNAKVNGGATQFGMSRHAEIDPARR